MSEESPSSALRRHGWCFICNQEVNTVEGGGFGFMISFPASWSGHPSPPIFFVHEDCARRVADPDFDFTGKQEAQESERREAEARSRAAEIEAAGPQDEPDGRARNALSAASTTRRSRSS